MLGCSRICQAKGKTDDARDFIDCALSVEPWNQDAQYLLSQLELDDSVSHENVDMGKLYRQAQAKAASGDLHGAVEDLNRLLQHSPQSADAHNDLGVLYYEIGDKNRALAAYEKAFQLQPDLPHVMKNLADFYLIEQERIEDAMRLYVKALEQKPDDTECLLATGLICRLSGKIDDAVEFYQRVVALEPWNEMAVKALKDLPHDVQDEHHEQNQIFALR